MKDSSKTKLNSLERPDKGELTAPPQNATEFYRKDLGGAEWKSLRILHWHRKCLQFSLHVINETQTRNSLAGLM